MSNLCCVAVFDSAVRTFGRPFFVRSRGEAVRSFTDEVNRASADNLLFQHPEDFELWMLGEFVEEDGVFSVVSSVDGQSLRLVLVRGKDVKNDVQKS